MAETVVCTPPVTFQEEPYLRKSLTPLYAGYIAKGLDAELTIGHGVIGNSIGPNPDTTGVEAATDALIVGISPNHLRDDNSEYIRFMGGVISDLVNAGDIEVEGRSVLHCECGVVNLDSEVLRQYPIDKLEHVVKKNDTLCCKTCEDPLDETRDDHLMLRPGMFAVSGLEKMIYPKYSSKKTLAMLHERQDYSRIVSKTRGDMYPTIVVSGTEFKIDPGLWLLGYPLYNGGGAEKTIVTAGASQHEHMLGSVALWSRFKNQDALRAFLHPRIQFEDTTGNISSAKVAELLQMYDASTLNIFISLSAQTSTHASTLRDADFSLSSKTKVNNTDAVWSAEPFETFDQLMTHFNGNKIRGCLKMLRQGKDMGSSNEGKIVKAILGIPE